MSTLLNPSLESESNSGLSDFLCNCLMAASNFQASDIHIATGELPFLRVQGEIQPIEQYAQPTTSHQVDEVIQALTHDRHRDLLMQRGAIDGAITFGDEQRYRYNIYQSSGHFRIALRRLENEFKDLADLGLESRLYDLCKLTDGLVLVAGPTGSGKSTTLATLIDRINQTRTGHIVTIEDPVEYIHKTGSSLVSQRQVGVDTPDFSTALVDALRQDPDIILVGELRDLETLRTALGAAETGHLVFASLHAGDGVAAIERMVSMFPGDQQEMIQNILSTSLRTIITQHLLLPAKANGTANDQADPRSSRNRVLASEVIHVNSAISNLIGSGNFSQIRSIMETQLESGMYTLDRCLAKLLRARKITETTARALARNTNMLFELAKAV